MNDHPHRKAGFVDTSGPHKLNWIQWSRILVYTSVSQGVDIIIILTLAKCKMIRGLEFSVGRECIKRPLMFDNLCISFYLFKVQFSFWIYLKESFPLSQKDSSFRALFVASFLTAEAQPWKTGVWNEFSTRIYIICAGGWTWWSWWHLESRVYGWKGRMDPIGYRLFISTVGWYKEISWDFSWPMWELFVGRCQKRQK